MFLFVVPIFFTFGKSHEGIADHTSTTPGFIAIDRPGGLKVISYHCIRIDHPLVAIFNRLNLIWKQMLGCLDFGADSFLFKRFLV